MPEAFDVVGETEAPVKCSRDDPTSRESPGSAFIRARRIEIGLPAAEVGRRCGVSGTFVAQLENGSKEPTDELLQKLAEALGLDPDAAFGAYGRVHPDLAAIVSRNPRRAQLLRALEGGEIEFRALMEGADVAPERIRRALSDIPVPQRARGRIHVDAAHR